MRGAIDQRDDFFQWIGNIDHLHFGTRYHDFMHADFRSRERTFGDREGVGVKQRVFVRRMQQTHELLPVFRFAQE